MIDVELIETNSDLFSKIESGKINSVLKDAGKKLEKGCIKIQETSYPSVLKSEAETIINKKLFVPGL